MEHILSKYTIKKNIQTNKNNGRNQLIRGTTRTFTLTRGNDSRYKTIDNSHMLNA